VLPSTQDEVRRTRVKHTPSRRSLGQNRVRDGAFIDDL
jgi:hypothetical protein